MNVALTGQRSQAELYDLATNVVQPKLLAILGVADVAVVGGLNQEVQVKLNYAQLEAYGITVQDVTNALARENAGSPAGILEAGRSNVTIRSYGDFQTIDQLKNLIVATTPNGTVFLHDVADVSLGYKPVTRLQRFNGQPALGLIVTKQSDANALQVADRVRATLASLRRQGEIPPDVNLIVTNDTSRFTRAALDAVQNDLILAILLTAAVLLLFLHTWRNTLIVILAIPTSLVSTFLVMYALGFNLDTISLMALALMIGILVDDSIVVLENIHRHLHLGEEPITAALNGRSEIGLAAIAITLTDVVVYVPVAFMQGNLGKLFREYGLTIAAATLFSLFVSFTLTPMLASRWLSARREGAPPPTGIVGGVARLWDRFTNAWEAGFDALRRRYGHILDWGLSHRPVVVLIGFLALGAAYAFIPTHLLSTEYSPQEDDSQFTVSIQLPPGTTLEATDAAVQQMEAGLRRIPEVRTIFTSVGVGGGGFGGSQTNEASIAVELVDKTQRARTVFQIISQVRQIGATIPDASVSASVQSPLQGGFGGVQIRVFGSDLNELVQVANQVAAVARTVNGVAGVRNAGVAEVPELRVMLDRDKMARLGVSTSSVSSTLRTLVSGTVVTEFRPENQDQLDVTVIGADADRNSINNLLQVPIPVNGGGSVPLSQVATLVPMSAPSQINRTDRQRVIGLSAITTDRPVGDIVQDLNAALAKTALPPGYYVTLAGQAQQLNDAFNALVQALSLSVLLMYMLLVALYESWTQPLAVLFSLPVALVGAFAGLVISGNTLNVFSMIGMIMLLGLVAKNAILLVDYTNTLRQRGLPRRQALVEAGPVRLRPILMTTCTILFAMLPLVLKFEPGAESRAPMAAVVMGGVFSSMLLTLVFVPVMYTYLDDAGELLNRIFGSGRRREKAPSAAETGVPAIAGGAPDC